MFMTKEKGYLKKVFEDIVEAKVLRGGSVSMSQDIPGTERVTITAKLYDNAPAKEYVGLKNISSEPIILHEAYSTTANGWSDEIVINPGEKIFKSYAGDGNNFARYVILD